MHSPSRHLSAIPGLVVSALMLDGAFTLCCGESAIPTVGSLTDLVACVDVAWTNDGNAAIVLPGTDAHTESLGVFAFASAFDTQFLARLPVVEANGIATRPLEVVENAGQPRRRVYLAADAVGVYTSAVSAANYPTNWIRSVYGQPPAWLSAADRQQWHAERDPNRKRLALSLISTDDVPAWCAMLTNRIESAAPTHVSFLQIYSNDIALACGSASPSIEVLVHAPSSVPSLGLYQSTNLLDRLGWRPIATLTHATDPIRWIWNNVDAYAFLAAGNASRDSDSDGLSDACEVLYLGTDPTKADTDGDGQSDGIEVLNLGLNPLSVDTDGDGICDSQELQLGTDPTKADTDGDGLSDFDEIVTYFGHTDPIKADTDGDGLNDGQEILTTGTYAAPNYDKCRDTDGDTLSDFVEVMTHGTDPRRADSDGDGIDDGYEISVGMNPLNPADAALDLDGDGFPNLTEYQWCTPLSLSNGLPTSIRLIARGAGSNELRRIATVNYNLAMGDTGPGAALVRVRPFLKGGTNLIGQRLYHTRTPGMYINGTAAASLTSPIDIPAGMAQDFCVTADVSAGGTNLGFTLTDATGYTGLNCRATFEVPKLSSVRFTGLENRYSTVSYGQSNSLCVALPTAGVARVYLDTWQDTGNYVPTLESGTDRIRVRVLVDGVVVTNTTVNECDWSSAFGGNYSSAHTRGIPFAQPVAHTVQVGIDFDDNGVLDSGEVSQTCVVYPLRINIGVDTDRNGVIDTADEPGKATNTLTRGALLPPPLRPILATNNSLAGLASIRVDVEPRAAVPGMGLRLVRKAEQSSAELSLINRFGAALPSGYSFKLGNWPTSGIPIYAAPPYARPGAFSPTNHWPIWYDLCLEAYLTNSSAVLASDTVRLKVAPVILPPECNAPEKIYSTAISIAGSIAADTNASHAWAQDMVKFVKYQTSNSASAVFIDLGHDNAGALPDLLRAEQGCDGEAMWREFTGGEGGNMMATPPLPDAPFGRIMVGSTKPGFPHPGLYWEAQGLQPVVSISNNWLWVGHVDEILMWAAPDKVLYASPWKAADLLHSEIAAGRSTNSLWFGFDAAGTNQTIRQVVIATNTAGYKLTTIPAPGLDNTANAATLVFSAAMFVPNDILRVDNEILKVTAAVGRTVTVARAQAGTICATHATGSAIYAYSTVMKDNLPVGPTPDRCPVNKIAVATNQLQQALGSYSAEFIPMPVLFAIPPAASPGEQQYCAATENVVNSLLGGGGVIHYPFTGCSAFENYIVSVLPKCQPWNVWPLHCGNGEIHCATTAIRSLDLSVPWWLQVTQWE